MISKVSPRTSQIHLLIIKVCFLHVVIWKLDQKEYITKMVSVFFFFSRRYFEAKAEVAFGKLDPLMIKL